jgi:hypothetical protein
MLESLAVLFTKIHNWTLMLKMSVKEKLMTFLTPFNWKDYDAPEPRNCGVTTQRGKKCSSFPKGLAWLQGPPRHFCSVGTGGLFLGG